jgi:hypothetical protein
MPVEFLTDDEAAAYGRYAGVPSQEELDRMFYLDDADRALTARRRGDHIRLGLALQLTTVRYLGTFLPDPLDVPTVLLERLAGQLQIADPSCVKRYTERRTTPFEHREEIKAAYGCGSSPRPRPGSRSGRGRGRGTPGRAPRPSSPTGCGGCGPTQCCCQG